MERDRLPLDHANFQEHRGPIRIDMRQVCLRELPGSVGPEQLSSEAVFRHRPGAVQRARNQVRVVAADDRCQGWVEHDRDVGPPVSAGCGPWVDAIQAVPGP